MAEVTAALATQRRMSAFDWTRVLLLGAIWGGSFFFARIAVAEIHPLTLVLFRVSIAAAALHLYLLIAGPSFRLALPLAGSLFVLALVNNVVPFSLIFTALNLTDTQLALIMVYSISNISFGVWVLKGFFDEISREQEEAAAMDGYGPWAIFFKVTLPLVVPGLLTVVLFNLIQTTNEFLLAFVLTIRESTTG